MNYNKELILCECGSMEHQIVFMWFDDNDDKKVFAQVHLTTNKTFWKRIISGVRYIFGYKSRFGNFDEIILTNDHVEGLKNVIKKLEN